MGRKLDSKSFLSLCFFVVVVVYLNRISDLILLGDKKVLIKICMYY